MSTSNKQLYYQEFFNLRKRQAEFKSSQGELELKRKISLKKKIKNLRKSEQDDIDAIADFFEKKDIISKPRYNGYYMFDGVNSDEIAPDNFRKNSAGKVKEAAKAMAKDAAKQAAKKMMKAVYRIIARAALQLISSIIGSISPYVLGGLAILALVIMVAAAILMIPGLKDLLSLAL